MSSFRVRDDRRKLDQFMGQVYSRDGRELRVGIPQQQAAQTYENGVTLLQVAIWNEFGTNTIPSRAWLTGWFDANIDLVSFWMRGEMLLVAQLKQTKTQAMRRIGEKCVASIKERIVAHIPPPNAQSTIDKKGSDTPLIHTGRLLGGIRSEVK